MKSIIIIIDYFGKWPDWFPIFLETCRKNPTVNWLFHTDCPFSEYNIDNVKFKQTTRDAYVNLVNKKLGVKFRMKNAYKLCDLRPMYGVIYEEEIAGFDFYGYGDIDVLYGNIRNFYTDAVLQNNVVSAHDWIISGHLALFKNVKWMRNAFKRYKGWRAILENPDSLRFDEDLFIEVFRYPHINPAYFFLYDLIHPFSKKFRTRLHLAEQLTTPFTPRAWRPDQPVHPEVWYWKDGAITNEIEGQREYIYLHLMNFISARWIDPRYQKNRVWRDLEKFVFATPELARKQGVRIDWTGIHPIT